MQLYCGVVRLLFHCVGGKRGYPRVYFGLTVTAVVVAVSKGAKLGILKNRTMPSDFNEKQDQLLIELTTVGPV